MTSAAGYFNWSSDAASSHTDHENIQEYLIETLDPEEGHITILRNVRTSRLAVLKSVKTLI
jgi:hypothetical protein